MPKRDVVSCKIAALVQRFDGNGQVELRDRGRRHAGAASLESAIFRLQWPFDGLAVQRGGGKVLFQRHLLERDDAWRSAEKLPTDGPTGGLVAS